MTDDRNDTGPRRRLGLPGQLRPGERLETVFRDELPAPADAALPGYPLTRVDEDAAADQELPTGIPTAPEPRGYAASAGEPTEGDVLRSGPEGATEAPESVSAEPTRPHLPAPAHGPAEPPQAADEHGAPPQGSSDVASAELRGSVAVGSGSEPLAARVPAPSRGSGEPDGQAATPGRTAAKAAPEPSVEAQPEVPLRAALEAVLMVVDEPVTVARLAEVLERPKKVVAEALAGLAAEYDAQERGFELRFVAGGWRFYTRAVCAPVVDRFVLDGQQSRLTQAALETLAVIAYRQPVSRSRVSAVRGVNCDGVMRTLVQRGLVEESGTEPETGAFLYRTTHHFLERMGLRGLDELPELAPFLPEADDVEADSQEGSVITEAIAEAVAAVD